jgi:hypothetical protein
MTQKEFLSRLAVLARLSSFDLTADVVALYDKLLAPLGYPALCIALERAISERNSRDPFPSIKAIRTLVSPEEDPQQLAILTSNRIWAAIGRLGWNNGTQARHELEGLAWQTILEAGGWVQVCEDSGSVDAGIFKAQMRDLARAVYERARAGRTTERVALPGPAAPTRALPEPTSDLSQTLRVGPNTLPAMPGMPGVKRST